MPDVQDFDSFFGVTVHDNVGRADQFAGSLYFTRPAKAGEGRQLFNAAYKRLSNIPASGGIVLLNVFNYGFKFAGGVGRPPNEPHD